MPTTLASRPALPRSCSTGRWLPHRCARRRSGHARGRAARPRQYGGVHRCHRAFRRLGLRSGGRRRRPGLACRAGPRLCRARRGDPDRARRDHVRPLERRRQGLGPLCALPRPRLRRGRRSRPRFRDRQRRRRARCNDRELQGRVGLGFRRDARRHRGCRSFGGQCGGQRHDRGRTMVLGGAVRDRRRIWRARTAALRNGRTC